MAELRFHPEAELEIDDAAWWYREQGGSELALRFVREVRRVAALIGENPRIGRELQLEGVEVRCFATQTFPYCVVYSPDESVYILAVAHQRRRPVYWLDRLRSR